jgi:hypothetical protein
MHQIGQCTQLPELASGTQRRETNPANVRKGRVNEAGQGRNQCHLLKPAHDHSVKLREQTPERQILLEAVVQRPRVKWPQCRRMRHSPLRLT